MAGRGPTRRWLPGRATPHPDSGPVLSALYTAHAQAVLGFVLRYVDDRQQAEDIVQETFLRAWRRIELIDIDGNPRSYLFTTARNVLTDRWRGDGRRPQLVPQDNQLTDVPSPDAVDAALESWLVDDALARLTAEHRAVVQALYYDGLSVAQAAQRLQIAEGTVKSRSYYAIRALRIAFQEMGVTR